MVEKGFEGSDGGQSSGEGDSGKGAWARVAQGLARQARWMEHKVSEEVEDLQRYFTKVLEFPVKRMKKLRK